MTLTSCKKPDHYYDHFREKLGTNGQTDKQTNRKTDGVHFIGPQFVDLKWNKKPKMVTSVCKQ